VTFRQPQWTREMPTSAVLGAATLGGLGRRMPAPGTWGSLAGLLYFYLCFTYMGIVGSLVANAVGAYAAVAFCGEAEARLGKRDPSEVILDEFVAMPLCFLGWYWITPGFGLGFVGLLAAGFALFRFYDIRKPLVIDSLQALPGGWGIVLDDTAAALATCATLHLAHAVWALSRHAGPG
jgi:phosphatidylglycerophosphatase A